MPPKHPFLLYLRSRLAVSLSIAAGVLAVLTLAFLRERSALPILGILLAYATVTFVIFFSRRGAEQIVKKGEQDRQARVRARIAHFAELRERISVLRLGDERINKAVEYFLQESGSYLEKCRELTLYSPVANERIERVLEICQVFLGERDEESTGRRYGVLPERVPPYGVPPSGGARSRALPEPPSGGARSRALPHGVPGSESATGPANAPAGGAPSADSPESVARDIMDCARVIKEKTVEDLLGVSDAERLAITKELEEDTK